jgi:hypothetical protein
MRVKITTTSGNTFFGSMDVFNSLEDILNDGRQFLPFTRPNGQEEHLHKNAIAFICEDEEE